MKSYSVLLLVFIVIALAGCGDGPPEAPKNDAKPEAPKNDVKAELEQSLARLAKATADSQEQLSGRLDQHEKDIAELKVVTGTQQKNLRRHSERMDVIAEGVSRNASRFEELMEERRAKYGTPQVSKTGTQHAELHIPGLGKGYATAPGIAYGPVPTAPTTSNGAGTVSAGNGSGTQVAVPATPAVSATMGQPTVISQVRSDGSTYWIATTAQPALAVQNEKIVNENLDLANEITRLKREIGKQKHKLSLAETRHKNQLFKLQGEAFEERSAAWRRGQAEERADAKARIKSLEGELEKAYEALRETSSERPVNFNVDVSRSYSTSTSEVVAPLYPPNSRSGAYPGIRCLP